MYHMNRSAIAEVIMVGFILGAMLLAAPRTPTYRSDVFPILEKNCLGCHSAGGTARLPLWTYLDAHEYADRIAAAATGKVMPPEHAGLLGEKGTLSKDEVDILVRWAAAGAPEGSAPK